MKCIVIDMRDGSQWAVPVDVIARNRAAFYADEFGGDVERSLAEDTLPLFEEHEDEIFDWSGNNMDWSDVKAEAFKVRDPLPLDESEKQEAWVNGEKHVEDVPR